MKIKFRLWFEEDETVIAGSGRIKLLEAIDEHGSISKAASAINLSYKKAWNLIDSMNTTAGTPLITTSTGGSGGGGTALTDKAKQIIQQYKVAREKLEATATELETLFKKDSNG